MRVQILASYFGTLGFIGDKVVIIHGDTEKSVVRDAERDASLFCPPLDIPPSEQCSAAATDHGKMIMTHSKVIRLLWRAAVYTPPVPGYWEFLFNLAQTTMQLNCVVIFNQAGCFSSTLGVSHQLERLCAAFRDRVRLASPALVEEDADIFKILVREHHCYANVVDYSKHPSASTAEMVYNSLYINVHLHRVTIARAVRAYESLDPKRNFALVPRWRYPKADSWSSVCEVQPTAAKVWWEVPTFMDLLERFPALFEGRYVINIGANNGNYNRSVYLPIGEFNDPANCFADHGQGGVFIEGDPKFHPELKGRFDGRVDIELHLEYVEPSSIVSIVDSALQRLRGKGELSVSDMFYDDVNLLKVDVDNCDCCFVGELLAYGFRPRFIHAEFHQLIPPPIAFKPRFLPLERGLSGADHRQCSLAAYMAMLKPYGYRLAYLWSIDAIFVRSDLLSLCPWFVDGDFVGERKWNQEYHCHPSRPLLDESYVYEHKYVYDFRRWSDTSIPSYDRLELVREHLHRAGFAADSYELWLYAP